MRNQIQAAFDNSYKGRTADTPLMDKVFNSLERADHNESRFRRKPFTTNLSFKTYNQLKNQGIVA